MRARTAACLAAGLSLAGCKLQANLDGGRYACDSLTPCPAGQSCVAGYCQGPADDATGPTDAGGGELGDVLLFTFDDRGVAQLRDRSGNRLDSSAGGAGMIDGVFGSAVSTDPEDFLQVPDHPSLHLGDQLTIEAWLWRDELGRRDPIFGDLTTTDEVAAEYSLEVTADDRLRFVTNDDCRPGPGLEAIGTGEIPALAWVHVAVAWNGATAEFYVDGEAAGSQPLEASPCELGRSPRIGRFHGADELTMIGRVDELKLSRRAKSQDEIRRSMDFDSTALVSRCGDGVIDEEACDSMTACCVADRCELAADNTPCEDGSCSAGVCAVSGIRATELLVGLYELEEGGGAIVTDTSGASPALNLNITNPETTTWGNGYLEVDGSLIRSPAGADKITQRCAETGEITLEAWIEPAALEQTGQIVAIGSGDETSASLGQYAASWNGRIRSERTSSRGTPQVSSAAGDVALELTHLIVRRAEDGTRTLFVDGRPRGGNLAPGGTGNWLDSPLALGNEVGDNDPWRGRLHLVAIYCRALSDLEVAQNYAAGADG